MVDSTLYEISMRNWECQKRITVLNFLLYPLISLEVLSWIANLELLGLVVCRFPHSATACLPCIRVTNQNKYLRQPHILNF
jgi:hypothetical protein